MSRVRPSASLRRYFVAPPSSTVGARVLSAVSGGSSTATAAAVSCSTGTVLPFHRALLLLPQVARAGHVAAAQQRGKRASCLRMPSKVVPNKWPTLLNATIVEALLERESQRRRLIGKWAALLCMPLSVSVSKTTLWSICSSTSIGVRACFPDVHVAGGMSVTKGQCRSFLGSRTCDLTGFTHVYLDQMSPSSAVQTSAQYSYHY